MYRGEASQVTRVEGLQEVKGLRSPDLADDDPIGPVSQRCPDQIRACDGRPWRLVSGWYLGPTRLKPNQVRLFKMYLSRLLDNDDAVVVRDPRGQRVQKRRLARSRSARDQDVPFGPDGIHEPLCQSG